MKKLTALLLTLTAVLSLAACGGRQGDFDEKAPDLNQYYQAAGGKGRRHLLRAL